MQEIKFRAWDFYGKKMYNVEELSFDKDGTLHGLLEDDDLNGRVFFNDDCIVDKEYHYFILMPFTGKRDTTRSEQFPEGQKIYTDDIVQVENHVGLVYYDEEYLGFFIRYYDEDAELCECPLFDKEVKLLSNIHQNPELLEVK